jgi:hypothetical protein
VTDSSLGQKLAELRARLRRYKLDYALGFMSRLSTTMENAELRAKLPKVEQDYYPASISPHQMAYIAKALIESGSNDHKRDILTFDEYKVCANLYNEAQSGGDPENWGIPEWEAFFLRTSYQQFPAQANQYALIPRTLRLYRDTASRDEYRRRFDIPTAFQQLTGLTVQEFVTIGFWVWALKTQRPGDSPFFRTDEFVLADVPLATQNNIQAFFNRASANYESFRRTNVDRPATDSHYGVFAANQLEWMPIIQTQSAQCVVPIARFLIQRVTTGLFYDLIAAHGRDFAGTFGLVVQEYVGDVLRSTYDPDQIIPEFKYGPDNRDSIDWTVVEGDKAVLIECKTRRVLLPTKVTADQELLRRDLEDVVKGVRQLHMFREDVRARVRGTERFERLTQLVPVVLVFDPFYLGNAPLIRDIVQTELTNLGVPQFDYQVLNLDELEAFMPAIKENGFANLLLAKMQQTEPRWSAAAFSPFQSFLLDSVRPRPTRQLPQFLRDEWRQFFLWFREQFPSLREVPEAEFTARFDSGQ